MSLAARLDALPGALQQLVRAPLLAILDKHADVASELDAVAEALAGWAQAGLASAASAVKAEPGAAGAGAGPSAPPVKVERASPAWCTLAAQSFVVPRGSFDVALLSDGSVALESKAQTLLVPAGGISCALELPLPNQDGLRVLLALREPLSVGKQSLSALLLTPKPSPKSKQLSCVVAGIAGGADEVLSDDPVAVWERVLAMLAKPVKLGKPSPEVFKSSKGKHGLPCYHGVEDGFLFPLKEGMVFIHRPTLFLPTAQIARIDLALSRGASGFSHGARNFDFVIETVDGDQHVIKMVEKEEYGCIMGYVERARINDPKRVRAGVAESEALAGDEAQGEGEDEDEDEDDSSFADSSSEGGREKGGEEAAEGDGEEEDDQDGSGEDDDEDNDDDEEEEGSDESSDEDRDSDIDVDDVDLSVPLKRDHEITLGIIETVRKRRRGEVVATVALDS